MNISFEYYRVFYYVVKCRNFTQAANLLMNNQPNVTRMIRNLESELGCTLFVRSNRGVTLTPEGERLYAHVKIAVEQILAGEDDLKHLITLQRGSLSIGASEVALRCFLLPILKEYQKCYPHVRLKVYNYSTPQSIHALRSGNVELAFVTSPIPNPRELRVIPIRDIQEVPVCGSGFSDLIGRKLTLADIIGYPIVSLGEQTQTYSFYADVFEKNMLSFAPDIEVATADQILPMVRNNLGIGFIPEDFLDLETDPDVHRLQLNTPIPLRSICCIQLPGKPLSIAARELEKTILAGSAT